MGQQERKWNGFFEPFWAFFFEHKGSNHVNAFQLLAKAVKDEILIEDFLTNMMRIKKLNELMFGTFTEDEIDQEINNKALEFVFVNQEGLKMECSQLLQRMRNSFFESFSSLLDSLYIHGAKIGNEKFMLEVLLEQMVEDEISIEEFISNALSFRGMLNVERNWNASMMVKMYMFSEFTENERGQIIVALFTRQQFKMKCSKILQKHGYEARRWTNFEMIYYEIVNNLV